MSVSSSERISVCDLAVGDPSLASGPLPQPSTCSSRLPRPVTACLLLRLEQQLLDAVEHRHDPLLRSRALRLEVAGGKRRHRVFTNSTSLPSGRPSSSVSASSGSVPYATSSPSVRPSSSLSASSGSVPCWLTSGRRRGRRRRCRRRAGRCRCVDLVAVGEAVVVAVGVERVGAVGRPRRRRRARRRRCRRRAGRCRALTSSPSSRPSSSVSASWGLVCGSRSRRSRRGRRRRRHRLRPRSGSRRTVVGGPAVVAGGVRRLTE